MNSSKTLTIFTSKHITVNTEETTTYYNNEESDALLSQIQELASKISCESAQHLGSLKDYEKIIEELKCHSNIELDLNLDLTSLKNFAKLAEDITELVSDIELKFNCVYNVSFIKYLKEIYKYLLTIDIMLDKFQKLVIYIKSKVTYKFSTPLIVINQELSDVLNSLNNLIWQNTDDCELKILNSKIKKEACYVRKINRKLCKISDLQTEMDSLICDLSYKNKYNQNC